MSLLLRESTQSSPKQMSNYLAWRLECRQVISAGRSRTTDPFRAALLRYSEALAGQISQTAVCKRQPRD